MDKIVEGKLYSTDNAEMVASDYSNYKQSLWWSTIELWWTKKGNFFVIYDSEEGEELEVVEEERAKEIMEKYGDTDKYIEVFGEVEVA